MGSFRIDRQERNGSGRGVVLGYVRETGCEFRLLPLERQVEFEVESDILTHWQSRGSNGDLVRHSLRGDSPRRGRS